MLGFRGHFTTKSRRFSVTLGSLRQARRDHQAARNERPEPVPAPAATTIERAESGIDLDPCVSDAATTLVVGEWRFHGLGYLTAGDALLAAQARLDHLDALAWARGQGRSCR